MAVQDPKWHPYCSQGLEMNVYLYGTNSMQVQRGNPAVTRARIQQIT